MPSNSRSASGIPPPHGSADVACLDTTVLLHLAGRGGRRRTRRAQERLRELCDAGEALTTTRFNVAELWVGVARSREPEQEQQKVEDLLAPLDILEFDEDAARVFGRVTAHLQERGTPVGDMDVLIASVALLNDEKLVTDNTGHFQLIPGIDLISY